MNTDMAVGKEMPLLDGMSKANGSIRFTGDIKLPGMLYAKMVTSIYAHANIRSIDTLQAEAVEGVVAVITAADLPKIVPSSRVRLLLARDRVIFVGQPVAVVLATSEGIAEDALELVMVDYEPLPAAISIDDALADDAPLVWANGIPKGSDDASMHGAAGGGESAKTEKVTNIVSQSSRDRGNYEQGFAESDLIVERTFTTAIVHQSYLEPHSIVAQPDPVSGGLTIWSSTQGQFPVRTDVSEILGIPEAKIRVVGMPVGGGFGGKIVLYEPLVALLALTINAPVKLILTRMEEMMAANPAPASRIWLKIGAKSDGTLNALHTKIIVDSGCYSSGLGGSIAFILGSMYKIPNFLIESTEVLTFKVSASAYRAPGAPSAVFALDSVIEEIATKAGLDSFDIRLKNASREGDLKSDGHPWPSIGMVEVLEALQAHPAWQERDKARAMGRGVGIAIGGWTGGVEPSAAVCMVDRDGMVNVHIGSADLSGTATTFTLMAAETFGVSLDQVRVSLDDTSSAPYAGVAAGSKTTYTVGMAVINATKEARQQALSIAADELEVAPEDLEIINGMISVKGVPSRSISLKDIAGKGMSWSSKYGPIIAQGRHADPIQAPGFCAQLAEIEVDQDTGEVKVHRMVMAQDAGRAINPAAVRGQMMGGGTQGLGWALYEEIVYSEDGQVLSGSWMDYTVAKANQAATEYDSIIVEVPTPHGPFGARGVGEPPVIATSAAVANAIFDATGAHVLDLPMIAPRVLAAIEKMES